jgi:hypothetical protein
MFRDPDAPPAPRSDASADERKAYEEDKRKRCLSTIHALMIREDNPDSFPLFRQLFSQGFGEDPCSNFSHLSRNGNTMRD